MTMVISGRSYEVTFRRGTAERLIGYTVSIDGHQLHLHPQPPASDSDRLVWKDHKGNNNELYQAIGEFIENVEM